MYVLKKRPICPMLNVKQVYAFMHFPPQFYIYQRIFIFFLSSSTSLFAQASLLPARTLRRFVKQAVGCNEEEEASDEEAFGEIGVDR